jgi:hypothetical protein
LKTATDKASWLIGVLFVGLIAGVAGVGAVDHECVGLEASSAGKHSEKSLHGQ